MNVSSFALHIRTIFVLAFAIGLGGCMSTQISTLRGASTFKARVTTSDFRHVDEGTVLRAAKIVTLSGGKYRPAGQDADGVWYVGPQGGVSIFYTERKRSDGKRLLEVYTGGVYVPHADKASARVFIQPDTGKMLLMSDDEADEAAQAPPTAGEDIQAESSVRLPGETLAESYLARSDNGRGGRATGATIVGAGIGGVIADELLIYDARGFRLMPRFDGVGAWFDVH
ncbi:hypothetical protein FHT32_006576 [Variovorax sp. SG517]|uniref:hypothetical protein n=1 Tax=Variovorax sp. SG517 TaxID=2587117 RepID=UPI00159DDD01|nr:hypothetical protein [Variovorax sp. SG517]NVM92883.1 hypothetical protein [Variovorax sp. SG517]